MSNDNISHNFTNLLIAADNDGADSNNQTPTTMIIVVDSMILVLVQVILASICI